MMATITVKVQVHNHADAMALGQAALDAVNDEAGAAGGATATVKTLDQGNAAAGVATTIVVQSVGVGGGQGDDIEEE